MKGKNKTEKKIEKVVKKLVGFKINVKISNCWQSIPESKSKKIFLNPFIDETDEVQNGIWSNWIKKNYNFEGNIFMISLLHEIGHLLTWVDFRRNNPIEFIHSQDLITECDKISLDLSRHDLIYSKQFKEICEKYHAIPTERIATDWAINFYRNNTKHVEKAFKNICLILKKFYKKNGVEAN